MGHCLGSIHQSHPWGNICQVPHVTVAWTVGSNTSGPAFVPKCALRLGDASVTFYVTSKWAAGGGYDLVAWREAAKV